LSVSVLINGRTPTDRNHALAFDDRGLQYGDGLFETALLTGGRIRFLEEHLERLRAGCERLGIVCPDRDLLLKDLGLLTAGRGEGILKMVVTRGAGARGYRADGQAEPTRIVALFPVPAAATMPGQGIEVRWCMMRLGRNPALAGIKHLNRLEQVLAQSEWNDPRIAEGLMLDTEGELVAATAGNLFLVRGGTLCTSDLRYCGIRGVMRGRVIVAAKTAGIPVEEQPLWPADLESAEEVFVTNAIRGMRPVVSLDQWNWSVGPITQQLAAALTLW
jgi:4-amino-4-deoxychorismate lyase